MTRLVSQEQKKSHQCLDATLLLKHSSLHPHQERCSVAEKTTPGGEEPTSKSQFYSINRTGSLQERFQNRSRNPATKQSSTNVELRIPRIEKLISVSEKSSTRSDKIETPVKLFKSSDSRRISSKSSKGFDNVGFDLESLEEAAPGCRRPLISVHVRTLSPEQYVLSTLKQNQYPPEEYHSLTSTNFGQRKNHSLDNKTLWESGNDSIRETYSSLPPVFDASTLMVGTKSQPGDGWDRSPDVNKVCSPLVSSIDIGNSPVKHNNLSNINSCKTNEAFCSTQNDQQNVKDKEKSVCKQSNRELESKIAIYKNSPSIIAYNNELKKTEIGSNEITVEPHQQEQLSCYKTMVLSGGGGGSGNAPPKTSNVSVISSSKMQMTNRLPSGNVSEVSVMNNLSARDTKECNFIVSNGVSITSPCTAVATVSALSKVSSVRIVPSPANTPTPSIFGGASDTSSISSQSLSKTLSLAKLRKALPLTLTVASTNSSTNNKNRQEGFLKRSSPSNDVQNGRQSDPVRGRENIISLPPVSRTPVTTATSGGPRLSMGSKTLLNNSSSSIPNNSGSSRITSSNQPVSGSSSAQPNSSSRSANVTNNNLRNSSPSKSNQSDTNSQSQTSVAPQPRPPVTPQSRPLVAPQSRPLVAPQSRPPAAPQPRPPAAPQPAPPVDDANQSPERRVGRERRRERRERRRERRALRIVGPAPPAPPTAGQTDLNSESQPPMAHLPDLLNSHVPPPYSTLPNGPRSLGGLLGPHHNGPHPPMSLQLPPPPMPPPGAQMPPSLGPFPPPGPPPQGSPIRQPPPETAWQFFGSRRSRGSPRIAPYLSDEEAKSCCGLWVTQSVSIRWFIIMIAFVGLCCTVVGTVLGAVKTNSSEYVTITLLMIGVGIVLVTVSGVAWHLTSRDAPCRVMLGLSPSARGDTRNRFMARMAPTFGRPHHPYAAMMYPEFQYRAPPPSYQASMQEYRLRLLLLDRHGGSVHAPHHPPQPHNMTSPPPIYRIGGNGTLGQESEYSHPPSYRSREGSVAHHPDAPSSVHPGVGGGPPMSHSRDPSCLSFLSRDSLSLYSTPEGSTRRIPKIINKFTPVGDSGGLSGGTKGGKDDNTVTIVQTTDCSHVIGSESVIVTVSGNESSVTQPGSNSEISVLAHL